MHLRQPLLNAFATLLVAAAAQSQPPVDVLRPADQFAVVRGLKLQYVDWGGR
jgi:hypothetical protein